MSHGDSNPNAGSNFVGQKKGIVPRPKGDYLQAGVENEDNKIEKIADAPAVHDREHALPKAGQDMLGKPAKHGHSYPGRAYPATSSAQDADCKTVEKKVRDKQLGSNGLRGN